MNSTALTGCIAMSMCNSFLSILAGVLFVVSQTVIKSNNPLCATSSPSSLSTTVFAFALVTSSFGSNKNGLAITSNLSRKYATNLATLTLSNALVVLCRVFWPKITFAKLQITDRARRKWVTYLTRDAAQAAQEKFFEVQSQNTRESWSSHSYNPW